MPQELAARFSKARVPVVLLARTVPGFVDRRRRARRQGRGLRRRHPPAAARLPARRLHRRPAGASTSRKRLDGYKAALRDCEASARPGAGRRRRLPRRIRLRAGLELLKRRPDAVFIANYLMTVGFMEALRQYRLRCPEDVGLVTCDDHPWIDSFSPRLTTIDLPKRELGAAAAQLLLERIARRQAAARERSC